MNSDYGVSFEDRKEDSETAADSYAADMLIPEDKYQEFISGHHFSRNEIVKFAKEINRDPGIVLGRLENDCYVDRNDWKLKSLHRKHKFTISV